MATAGQTQNGDYNPGENNTVTDDKRAAWMTPPPDLVRGCDSPEGERILADWLDEHGGDGAEFREQQRCRAELPRDGEGDGHDFGVHPRDGYGCGASDGYGTSPGNGCGNGIISGYGTLLGDGQGCGHDYGTYHGDGGPDAHT